MNLISLVIITSGRIDYLKSCLNSINLQNLKNFNIEIIIVNDDVNNKLQVKYFYKITKYDLKIFNNEEKKFMIKSRNIGAKFSKGKYILFIDDDNILDKDMILNLYNFIEKKDDCAIIGPMMYDKNDILYLTYQKINLYTSKTRGFINHNKNKYFRTDGIPNCFMLESSYLKSINYFNEELRQTFTEPDITFAFRNKYNKESYMISNAKVNHIVDIKNLSRKIGTNYSIKAYCLLRNRAYVVTKYGNFLQKITFFFIYPIWPILYSIIALANKNPKLVKHYIKGCIHGYKLYLNHKKIDNSYIEKEFV